MKKTNFKKALSIILACGSITSLTNLNPMILEATSETRLNYNTLTLSVGDSQQLKVENSSSATFKIGNSKIAKVDSKGVVTGLKKGTTSITVTSNGKNYYCRVTVSDKIQSLTLNKTSIDLKVGQSEKLIASCSPSTASQRLIWSSSDKKIVDIGTSGRILAKRDGVATITVTSAIDNSKTATCKVNVGSKGQNTVRTAQSVLITGKSNQYIVGKSYQLQGLVFPLNATNKNVTWESSDDSIATIDKNGLLKILKEGTVMIKCNSEDGYAYSSITFTTSKTGSTKPEDPTVLVSKIEIKGVTNNLKVEDSVQLQAIVSPTNATNKNVNWKSETPDIATIDSSGKLTIVGKGEAIITCESEDKACKTTISFSTLAKEDEKPSIIKVSKISVPELEQLLSIGDVKQLTTKITPENATNKKVTWETSNSDIAEITATGRLTIKKAGKVDITVSATDGSGVKAIYHLTIPEKDVTIPTTNIDIVGMSNDLAVGDSIQLEAIVKPTNATNKNVIWSSSNLNVATITNTGLLKIVGTGEVTITCRSQDGFSGQTMTFTINKSDHNVKISRITLSGIPEYTYVGDTYRIIPSILPENATNKSVIWESSDPSIATIDENGNFRALKDGTVKITCRATDGSSANSVATIAVNKKSSDTIYASSIDIKPITTADIPSIGGTFKLTATITPSNVTNKNIVWKSSNESVATVDSDGNVTILKAGTVRISAISGDRRCEAYVEITIPNSEQPSDIKVTSIEFTNAPTKAPSVGDSFKLDYRISPENATNKNVIWTSSNPSVATVDEDGNVSVVGKGTTTITCKAEGSAAYKSMTFTTASTSTSIENIELSGFPTVFDSRVIGQQFQLQAKVIPESLPQDVIWSSDNESVATVDENGLLTIVGYGTVNIRCSTPDGAYIEQPLRIQNKVQSIDFIIPTNQFYAGEEYNFGIKTFPIDATNKEGTWEVDDSEIATINQNGVLTTKKNGTVTITYRLKDGSGSASVTIPIQNKRVLADTETPVTTINVTGLENEKQLFVGEEYQLSAEVFPEEASNKEVLWISNNPEVATISEDGVLRVLKEGTVSITCQAKTFVSVGDDELSASAEVGIIKAAMTKPESGDIGEIPEPEIILVDNIQLDAPNYPLVGRTYKIRKTVYPTNATNPTLSWKSTNPEVLTIDDEGNITTHKRGNAVVICSSTDGSEVYTRQIFKVLNPVTNLSVEKPTSMSLNIPIKLNLTKAYFNPSSSIDENLVYEWSVTDRDGNPTDIASIDKKGNLTIHKKTGQIVIKVACDNNTPRYMQDDIYSSYTYTLTSGEWAAYENKTFNAN